MLFTSVMQLLFSSNNDNPLIKTQSKREELGAGGPAGRRGVILQLTKVNIAASGFIENEAMLNSNSRALRCFNCGSKGNNRSKMLS